MEKQLRFVRCGICGLALGEKATNYKCLQCIETAPITHSIFMPDEPNEDPTLKYSAPSLLGNGSELFPNHNIVQMESPFIIKLPTVKFNIGKKSNSKCLEKKIITTATQRVKCNECNQYFKTVKTLQVHEKMHAGKFNYKCEYCEKTFMLSEYYQRHLRVHTKEKPYTCNYCGKSFSQSNTLKQHIRTHTGEKPYHCMYCEKSFGVRDYLNKHIRTHTGERPYECTICKKRYTQPSALKIHQKIHRKCDSF